jgi:ATP-dependent Clp protease ATP-binding subunit ClpX
MEAVLLDSMFDLPDMKDVHEIVINDDVIEGKSEPIKVLSGSSEDSMEKKPRPKPAKTH